MRNLQGQEGNADRRNMSHKSHFLWKVNIAHTLNLSFPKDCALEFVENLINLNAKFFINKQKKISWNLKYFLGSLKRVKHKIP